MTKAIYWRQYFQKKRACQLPLAGSFFEILISIEKLSNSLNSHNLSIGHFIPSRVIEMLVNCFFIEKIGKQKTPVKTDAFLLMMKF